MVSKSQCSQVLMLLVFSNFWAAFFLDASRVVATIQQSQLDSALGDDYEQANVIDLGEVKLSELDESIRDLAKIDSSISNEFRVIVRCDLGENAELKSVTSTCGCAATVYTPGVYHKGDAIPLVFHLKPSRKTEAFEYTFHMEFNKKSNGFRVKGKFVEPVRCVPKQPIAEKVDGGYGVEFSIVAEDAFPITVDPATVWIDGGREYTINAKGKKELKVAVLLSKEDFESNLNALLVIRGKAIANGRTQVDFEAKVLALRKDGVRLTPWELPLRRAGGSFVSRGIISTVLESNISIIGLEVEGVLREIPSGAIELRGAKLARIILLDLPGDLIDPKNAVFIIFEFNGEKIRWPVVMKE